MMTAVSTLTPWVPHSYCLASANIESAEADLYSRSPAFHAVRALGSYINDRNERNFGSGVRYVHILMC